jgi:cytochrome P450
MSTSEADAVRALENFDLWDPQHEKVKWDAFAYARSACPIARTTADGRNQYIVTRYDDVRRVLEDPELFSSRGVTPRPCPVSLNPLDVDPPYHTELRKILNPLFTPRALTRYADVMHETATRLVDAWAVRGRVRLMKEFGDPFVGEILARVVFGETDTAAMMRASDVVLSLASEGNNEAFHDLARLSAEYLDRQRDAQEQKPGVLQTILDARLSDGEPLTREQQLGVITVLFLGGLDTTRSAIGSIAFEMAVNPQFEDRIRNPEWVRDDMNEFLRLASPVGVMGRFATRDVTLGGVRIREGEQLLLRYDSANRDETRFPAGWRHVFDGPRLGNAAFGLGVHRCLGIHLARMQIAIAFEELLKRVTGLRFAAGTAEDVEWAAGISNGPHELDLAFEAFGG